MDRAQVETLSGNTRSWLRSLVALVFLLISSPPGQLRAQSSAPSTGIATPAPLSIPVPGALKANDATGDEATDTPRATLHVYTNLMQVPVLVLTSDHQPMKPIPESKFRLSLDSGPPFKPTYVRREGDDPLELAILIDESKPENDLLPGIAAAVASLVPDSLRSWDRVSVYTMDCALVRTAYDLPADPVRLREDIDRAMAGWRERRHERHSPRCQSSVPLFDAMSFVTSEIRTLPGRRVLLVLTDGLDRGSKNNWNRLLRFEQSTSTAVFGLRSQEEMNDERSGGFNDRQNALAAGIGHDNARAEDRFDIICQLSGGVQFAVSDRGLAKGLVRFVEMLRERYIIEYPRSNTATAGIHALSVTIPDGFAYVRAAGISVPLADRKLLDNPMTLPSQAEVPIEGPRHVLEDTVPTPSPYGLANSTPVTPPPPQQ